MEMQQQGRRNRLLQERRHDVYRERQKQQEPTVCKTCKAVYHGGRWVWGLAPEGARSINCPACRRIADQFPAGQLSIKGEFFPANREELEHMFHNIEKQEKQEHPLERLMAITDTEGFTLVTTTGIHLAQRLGKALTKAYQGELEVVFGEGEESVRLTWIR